MKFPRYEKFFVKNLPSPQKEKSNFNLKFSNFSKTFQLSIIIKQGNRCNYISYDSQINPNENSSQSCPIKNNEASLMNIWSNCIISFGVKLIGVFSSKSNSCLPSYFNPPILPNRGENAALLWRYNPPLFLPFLFSSLSLYLNSGAT